MGSNRGENYNFSNGQEINHHGGTRRKQEVLSGWSRVMEEREMPYCVRGYHINSAIWTAAIGEELVCSREPTNATDGYAVTVEKDGTIIGHLPRKISKVCFLFLRRGGSINCTVTGGKIYSADLPQGELEIPCTLLFKGKAKEIQKLETVVVYGVIITVNQKCILIV